MSRNTPACRQPPHRRRGQITRELPPPELLPVGPDQRRTVGPFQSATASACAIAVTTRPEGAPGGFNRWSQHLHVEVGGWGDRGDGRLLGRGGRRCVRRGGLRWPGESTGSGSGWRSPGECRVRTPALRLVCPRWLARAGSATAGGSGRSAWPRCRGGTCRSGSGRRWRSCAPGDAASARSPGVWAGRRRRSRGSCAGTLRAGAAGWSTGPRRPSGTRTGGHAARRSRNSLRARPCGSTCKTGSPARSPGPMARRCRPGCALDRTSARSPSRSALGQVVEPGADREPAAGRLP